MSAKTIHEPLQAGLAFAAFIAVGVMVWGVVSLLTGDLNQGLLYGLVPGVALGALAFVRLRRGGLFRRERMPDNEGREEA